MVQTDKDWAKLALSLMDLTSLNEDDTDDVIRTLCGSADTPFGHPAAVCVYSRFVNTAKTALADNGVKVATVANFPHGGDNVAAVAQEVQAMIASGADEVDVVLPYRALMNGNEALAAALVAQSKAACGNNPLKVIIESGELKTPTLIQRASEIAIKNGADFVKTSTGKVTVNATLEAAEIILNTIKASGKNVGFKAAGGVRSVEDAKAYLQLAQNIMGDDWVSTNTFRFGASGLLGSLLATLTDETPSENITSY